MPLDEVLQAVVYALEQEELPNLEVKLKNNDGSSYAIQQSLLEKMNAEMDDLRQQEEKQFDLVEKGIYSDEMFLRRNRELHAQMDELKERIKKASLIVPKQIDYANKIITLREAISALKDDSFSAEKKNKLLKTIIKRIVYEYVRYEGKGKIIYKLHIELLL